MKPLLMYYILFRFRVKRFCVRDAVRNTRLEVVMKDIKPPNIVNVQTVKCHFDSAVLNEFVNNTCFETEGKQGSFRNIKAGTLILQL